MVVLGDNSVYVFFSLNNAHITLYQLSYCLWSNSFFFFVAKLWDKEAGKFAMPCGFFCYQQMLCY